ncbi:hypothetical protein GCM10025864_39960 [Luteimicrobium album]|uniref:DUF1361 domain-containing protein n=1 Tax=Luteimicrobium album TaxID=1054550 RepID=A0ABQ6I7M9_9MICO|nr:DUF1361 domain-containing protein [Luteimicrobium album]GMA26237.1 hypothetical protein GCM10025864_39960 [Luteimicrobium album]
MLTSLVLGAVGMNVLALALVLARAPAFRTRLYRPMLLNLALSAAPLGVLVVTVLAMAVAVSLNHKGVAVAVGAVLGLVWLLLLPNSGYLVTELNLSHRKDGEDVPLWYDIVLVVSLAMSGVLNTVLAVFVVQLGYVLARYGDTALPLEHGDSHALAVVILLLVALGMYLGRYVRLNSWDVRHPTSLVRKVTGHAREVGVWQPVVFTVLYGAFFALMYLVVVGPVIAGLVALEQRG